MKRRWLFAIGAAVVAAGTFGVIRWRHHASGGTAGCTRAVYASEAIVCAEQPDGFWCWGDNGENGLGDPGFNMMDIPTHVAFPHKGLVSLSMRYQSGAAIDHGHALYWGRDMDSWLGEPEQYTHPEPIHLRDFPDHLVAIRTGEWFLCAKQRSGQLYCRFNNDENGRVWGFGVILPGPVEQFAVSKYLACAVQGGHVYCWGPDEPWATWPPKPQADGKLAITPKPLAGFSGIAKQVSVDYGNAYVLRRDGSLWASGGNQFGELGIGTHDTCGKICPSHPLVQVERLGHTVVKVASGYDFSCALVRDGSVYCWGENGKGQAGPKYTEVGIRPTVKVALAPQRIDELGHDNADIVLSNDFGCSIKRNRSVWCWGSADTHVGRDDACSSPNAPPDGCRPDRVPLVCPK